MKKITAVVKNEAYGGQLANLCFLLYRYSNSLSRTLILQLLLPYNSFNKYSLEGTVNMGDSTLPQKNHRDKALEELRSNKIGVLIQIIDELDRMGLKITEIETVLGTCGLNTDCATRFGMQLKEKKHLSAHQ